MNIKDGKLLLDQITNLRQTALDDENYTHAIEVGTKDECDEACEKFIADKILIGDKDENGLFVEGKRHDIIKYWLTNRWFKNLLSNNAVKLPHDKVNELLQIVSRNEYGLYLTLDWFVCYFDDGAGCGVRLSCSHTQTKK